MTLRGNDQRKQLGRFGENYAAQYLTNHHYEIIEQNWKCKTGEIDIIARFQGVLVFVEVRTRRLTGSFGLAKESVDFRKQRQVRQTSQVYIHQHKLYEAAVRFDVITIECNEAAHTVQLDHIEDAF